MHGCEKWVALLTGESVLTQSAWNFLELDARVIVASFRARRVWRLATRVLSQSNPR